MENSAGLYIHLPFCAKKCKYCDFYSLSYNGDTAAVYTDGVIKEFQSITKQYPSLTYDTAYLGGGTPGILEKSLLQKLIATLKENPHFKPAEFTIEVNPVSHADFSFYKNMGITRVSVGVQTLDASLLKMLGRLHSADEARQTLAAASAVFSDVSADLMIGLPGQTTQDVLESLEGVFPYVNHVSVYILKLSDDVPLAKEIARGALQLPDDDQTADVYDAAYAFLQTNGYARYEISNFARENAHSRHNIKYWRREPYIGLGAAAHSFLGGARYENPADITRYLNGENAINSVKEVTLSQEESLFEEIMLRLRLKEGLNIDQINRGYNLSFCDKFAAPLAALKGVVSMINGNLFINEDKMLLQSAVARAFLE
jgi:oxygen-independent coproporphyrinogen-3 oxidase